MIKELEKKIEGRFNTLEETLEYQIKSINEAVSIVNEIQYLLYLRDNLSDNKNNVE